MTDLASQAIDQLVDVATHWVDAVQRLDIGQPIRIHPSQVRHHATQVVGGLTSDDPHQQHEALISLVPWLGPPSMPTSDDWWTTPLGLLAAAAQDEGDGWVTQSQAADALGVTRQTVSAWIDDGRLRTRQGGPTGGRLVSRHDVSALVVERANG